MTSSMKKSMRLPTKIVAPKSSWIGLRKENFQLSKPSNIMVDLVLSLTTFGKHYTSPSTLLKIVKLISIYWKKFPTKK